MRSSLLLVFFFTTTALARANDGPTPAEIRQAIQRSLPYIETEAVNWMNDRKCMSCHVVPFMLWSHNEGLAHGVKIDVKKLEQWTDWSVDDSLRQRNWFKLSEAPAKGPKVEPFPDDIHAKLKPVMERGFVTEQNFFDAMGKVLDAEELAKHRGLLLKRATLPKTGAQNDGGSVESMGQVLLGRTALAPGKKMDEFMAAAADVILKWQESDGSWKAGGQLPTQNRPRTEADAVTTAWTVLALATLDRKDPAIAKGIDAGLAFVRKSKPGKSHESLLLHLMLAHKFGPAEEAERLLKDVLAQQNDDGGWGWLCGAGSDAFATGQSLYAFHVIGAKANTAVQRAQKYLLDTQTKEGNWATRPQAVSSSTAEGRLRRLVPIYHFWGTTWAAIGLARSLPD